MFGGERKGTLETNGLRYIFKMLIVFLRKVLLRMLSIRKKTKKRSDRFNKNFLFSKYSPFLKKAVEVVAFFISIGFNFI